MSGTPSRPPSAGIAVAFGALTSVCLAFMIVFPAEETIPYHLIYLSVTIVYALAVWPFQRALLLLIFVAATTGVVLVQGALEGLVDWHETSEAVLMPAIFLGMLWHSQRQIRAQHHIEIIAARQQALLEHERVSLQDTTHAIRTPITVARGHVSLVMDAVDNLKVLEDLAVVVEQLDRIARLAASLLALHELDDSRHVPRIPVDVADLVSDVTHRWASSVEREWQVVTPAGSVAVVDEHRMELSVEALLENAVKFTEPGGRIRVSVERHGPQIVVAVDDSGPGIPLEHRVAVFDRFWKAPAPSGVDGTGLGLALVRAVAEAHSGTVTAGPSDLGGARVSMSLAAMAFHATTA
jgi:signal transduction histidine kinase